MQVIMSGVDNLKKILIDYFEYLQSGLLSRFSPQARNNMILTICYFDQNAANYYHLHFKDNIYEKVSGASQKVVLN